MHITYVYAHLPFFRNYPVSNDSGNIYNAKISQYTLYVIYTLTVQQFTESLDSLVAVRFRFGHVPGSLNLPHQHTFQPDGSLSPSSSSASLSSVKASSVVVVVANKGESGPVVRVLYRRTGFNCVV